MFLARFLYGKLKGYRFLIAFAIILTFAEVGTDILTPFPLKFILDKFTLEKHPNPVFPGANALLGFFKQFNPQNDGVIAFSIAMIIALGLLGAIISYIQLYLASLIAKNLTVRLDQQLFDHLQYLPLSWHEQEQRQGDIVQRITGNIPDIEKFVADGLVDLLAGTLTIVGIIAVMLLVNWQFTLLSLVIIPLLFATVLLYTRSIKAATKKEKKVEGEIGNIATEAMAEITEIKAFTLEGFMSSLFKGHLSDKLKHGMRAGSLQAQFTPLVTLLVAIGTAIITGIGAYVAAGQTFTLGVLTISAQAVTFGTLILFISYLKQLYQPMRDLSKLTNLASSATSGAERIQEVLSQKPEDLLISPDSKEPARFAGTITYKHTFFSYKKGLCVPTG
jgi:ATP-binding cassette subfamily B protein